jgi:hypothetical protein
MTLETKPEKSGVMKRNLPWSLAPSLMTAGTAREKTPFPLLPRAGLGVIEKRRYQFLNYGDNHHHHHEQRKDRLKPSVIITPGSEAQT